MLDVLDGVSTVWMMHGLMCGWCLHDVWAICGLMCGRWIVSVCMDGRCVDGVWIRVDGSCDRSPSDRVHNLTSVLIGQPGKQDRGVIARCDHTSSRSNEQNGRW